jgi:hypothetical protein
MKVRREMAEWRATSVRSETRGTYEKGGTGEAVRRLKCSELRTQNFELRIAPIAFLPPVSPLSLESGIRYSPVGSALSFR